MKHELKAVTDQYAMRITDQVKRTIKRGDDRDPVARQYLPSLEELKTTPEEDADPIGDDVHSPVKGIVHRYENRVLLKPVHVCAVYCRYCFRREMVGPGEKGLSEEELEAALDYIRDHPEIWEVILTGGDPLVLSARKLSFLIQALDEIDHVKVIRIHTRVPIADPDRVTPEMSTVFKDLCKPVYIAVHVNHAQELDARVKVCLDDLRKAGVILLGQSVLLKDVNDTAQALQDLFEGLIQNGVQPYYLHHPDLARGTGHFRVSIEHGQRLMEELRGRVSGICLPTYMLDIPGGYGKVPLTPCALESLGDAAYAVTDRKGQTHLYPPQKTETL